MSLQRLAYTRNLKEIRKATNFQSFVPIILEFHTCILLTRETNEFMYDAHTAIERVDRMPSHLCENKFVAVKIYDNTSLVS